MRSGLTALERICICMLPVFKAFYNSAYLIYTFLYFETGDGSQYPRIPVIAPQ